MNLTHRKAKIEDLPRIIELLFEDNLGQTRESKSTELDKCYIKAFHKIDSDPNQYLMVVENISEIIYNGTQKVDKKIEKSRYNIS